MPLIPVDIAEYKVSADPEATLLTYALGSSVVVVVHDARCRIGAMLHTMLPTSSAAPHHAQLKPAMFADSGLPLLFDELARRGSDCRNLAIKVAGGARRYEDRSHFDIGRRNYLVVRKLLWRRGLLVAAEDLGGTGARTVRLEIATGRVTVSAEGQEREL